MNESNVSDYKFMPHLFESFYDANHVIYELYELFHKYGFISVADYYDSSCVTSDVIDNEYGWYTVNSATITECGALYLLTLEEPVLLTEKGELK